MTPRLPILSGRDAIDVLTKFGFAEVSQRGSHLKLRNQAGRTVIVPLHRELARGTLRSILRQADVTPDDFVEAIG